MFAQDCVRAYRANSVLTAPPGQLVLLLYDGVLTSLAAAKAAFERPASDFRRYEVINSNLRKARSIIYELQASLNFEASDEFAGLMHRLYDYYNRRLLEANLNKQVEPVLEVERLVGELRNAWAEMLRKPQGSPAEAIAAVTAAR